MASVDSQHYDHAASHLGKAVGITNLLRGTPFHAARYALDFAEECFQCSQITARKYLCLADSFSIA